MRLKKLILHGFKSFADRTEISFDGGITGVVGPNGCGKSNIADAVRWVLGEQSAKTLRGGKMEDVIFNGTEKRKRLAFCEVSLVFDNEDRQLPIDYAEVAVTRRVYRSGESEYKLNAAPCRLKDIVDLFRDTGIGRDGYSLVGQGRIDEILSARSEDRRQVFEEAAGIVKYKTRKAEAERRMERTAENLSRVEDILGELEERIEPLKAQSETAKEYLTLRDELKGLELNAFLVRAQHNAEQMRAMDEELAAVGDTLAALQRQAEEAAAERDAAGEALKVLEATTAEKLDEVQEQIRSTETCEGEVRVLDERISALTREEERLNAEVQASRSGSEGVKERIAKLTACLASEAAEVKAREADVNRMEEALGAAEGKLSALEAHAEEEKQAIIAQMQRMSDAKSRKARLTALKASLEEQLENRARQRETEAQGERSLDEHIARMNEELAEANANRAAIERDAAKCDEQVKKCAARLDEIAREGEQNRVHLQQSASRLKLLEEMKRDYEGYNQSVKQVLLQARRMNLKGVHGVVADLIRVPQKLERAIDMVLGAALQYIVVDCDEDAKQMIDYLRKNRLGRATFLPIQSVRPSTMSASERSLLKMSGCVGIGSEAIGFDEIYRPVVENLLGRTMIAEDLQTGIAIQRAGHYKFRLVTLEGDVMHSGGSLTGGSVQSRMTSLLSRSREIEQTRKEVARMETALSELSGQQAAAQEERRTLKEARASLYEALRQAELDCARAETQAQAASDERKSNSARAQEVRDEFERLQNQLEEINASLAQTSKADEREQANTDQKRQNVKVLQDEIYALRTDVEGQRAETTRARVDLATRQRGLQARAQERDNLAENAENAETLMRERGEQLRVCEGELSRAREALKERSALLEERRGTLARARGEYDALDAKRRKTVERVQRSSERLDALHADEAATADREYRLKMQRARVENEDKQLADRIWEDYELTLGGAQGFAVADFRLAEASKRISQIKKRIKEMGPVHVAAVDEYRSVTQRVTEMRAQRDDLVKAGDDLMRIVRELEEKMLTQFAERFALINENFSRTFHVLFGGGKAQLQLSDPKDALNCGIEIVAQPPGKKLQMLSLLSGGERALTAIAILFAILDLKPTPFCILDEIEAALDDANIDTYADYLKSYSENTQFIVITHRKGTMERCDALYGVVMEEKGISKTVSVRLDEAVA